MPINYADDGPLYHARAVGSELYGAQSKRCNDI